MKKSTTPAGIIKGFLQCLYAAILCLAAFFQLQIASGVTNVWGDVIFQYLVWNLVLLGGVFLLLCLPWKRVCTGGILFCVIVSLLGIANHYTLALHGSLLTVDQFQNARTALSVIGSYNLLSDNLLPGLFVQLAFLAGGILLSWGEYVLCEKRLPSLRRERPVRVGVSLLLLLSAAVLFIGGDVTPYLKTVRNSWEPATTVQYHGYPMVLCSGMMDFDLIVPGGYSSEALSQISMPDVPAGEAEPADIILILNETFSQPSVVTDIETDRDYLEGISNLSGAILGSAVAKAGGGTNITEAELLTGNPQAVVGGTPFNILHMEDTSSIVSLLKGQGYHTIATHCMSGTNYHRSTGYPALGFDEIHFVEDYTDTEEYGQRPWATDESVYKNLIRWYEQATQEDQPVFAYCLTIQNHGDWDVNPPEQDLIHAQYDSNPAMNDVLSEFLSCVSLSDQAFVDLCDYFRTVDRKVIVCMLGDHSPSFVEDITTKELGDRKEIAQATVPLVIWANFDLELTGELPERSVTAVAPLLVSLAGARNSPYFQYILNLSQSCPVITNWGVYTNALGQVQTLTNDPADATEIWNYFYLAHNNLLPDSLDVWFQAAEE